MVANRAHSLLKVFFRIGLSALALYLVVRQLDTTQLAGIIRTAHPGWLLAGLFLYVLSKLISSLRLTQYLRANNIAISEEQNLRLYWVGMFYNLFLPGGIGGDGYKIWVLNRDYGTTAGKGFQSILFDRLNGLFILIFLALLLTSVALPDLIWKGYWFITAMLALMVLILIHSWFAKQFMRVVTITTAYSLGVQLIQLAGAWTLLRAVNVSDSISAYLAVFLVSSAVAVLPISIGGVGIRELVFVMAAQYTPVLQETAVAFSLLFFVITVIGSLPGAFIDTRASDSRASPLS